MINWTKISDQPPPIGALVLLLWDDSGHVEDARIEADADGDWYYVLFDGETFKTPPSDWAYLNLPERLAA